MREGNNDILLAGDDALGYLVGPVHKRYPMIFIWGHLVRADLMIDFSILLTSPLVHTCTHLEYPHLLCM